MPIRSCEPSVVRCRVTSSFARVIAVEKPTQYSVPRTSLSIVLGMPISGNPVLCSSAAKPRVSSPPITTRQPMPSLSRFRSTIGVKSKVFPSLDSVWSSDCEIWAGRMLFLIRIGLVRDVCSTVPPPWSIARVFARQQPDVARIDFLRWVKMRQALPASADPDYRTPHLTGAVDYRLDVRVQSRHVSAARQNSNLARAIHDFLPLVPHSNSILCPLSTKNIALRSPR